MKILETTREKAFLGETIWSPSATLLMDTSRKVGVIEARERETKRTKKRNGVRSAGERTPTEGGISIYHSGIHV